MRILFLTHRLPYAANRGDRIRALNLLRFLAPHADVDLVSLVHDRDEENHAGDLRDIVASVRVARTHRWMGYAAAAAALPTRRPLTHALLDAPGLASAVRETVATHPPDLVLAYCSGMARVALGGQLRQFPFVLGMVDLDSEKWKELGVTARAPARWIYAREARSLAVFEPLAARRAEAVLVVNERERASLLALAPDANVQVVPNGIALDEFRPPSGPSSDFRVTFCGVMDYEPNEAAAIWLAREVWPAVHRRHPSSRLSLVGANPTAAVRRLAEADPSIDVTGTVPDVRPYLWRSALAVAPLRVARGIQNKVLEALAAGLPCVVTRTVEAGLPQEALPGCAVADEPAAFAAAIADLLSLDPARRRACADLADLQPLTWPARLAPLLPLLESAISHSTNRAIPSSKGVEGS